MGVLRKLVAIVLALLALVGGATLAVAAGGGGTRGDSGEYQYDLKPGCGPDKTDGVAGGSGRHTGQPPKAQNRGDCPDPPGQNE
ncbi:MAG: hypothetical protein ACRDM0_23695 [Thermoleophilaceae bacterium]